MKRLIYLAALVVILILQLALTNLNIFPSTPNLLLVYLCLSLLFLSFQETMVLSLAAGLLLDFFSGLPDGVMILSTVAAVSLAFYIGKIFFTEKFNDFVVLFYILSATVFFGLTVFLISQALGFFSVAHPISFSSLSGKIGIDVIFNVLFLYPVYWFHTFQAKLEKRVIVKT